MLKVYENIATRVSTCIFESLVVLS